jgi:purine nucleosidase
MLLGWPGVELVGITTTIDPGGRRAGCGAHCLKLAGRDDIPVAAGAGVSLTTLRRADPSTDDERYWPSTLAALPSPPGGALDLLDHSIQQGATIGALADVSDLGPFPG